jgi:EmrB/QacA subfamily drug resistance transporter
MPRHWQVLIVVTAGAFLANLDLFIVNVAFPAIHADFPDVGLSGLSWVLNGYAIVFAALLVPAGRFADRLGRKRMFLWGMGVFLLASVLCAAAPDVAALVAARVLQATGAAVMIPTSLALLLPEFAPNRRRAAVGLWTAGAAMAATLGPVVGGLLVAISWRWVFLVNVPIGCVTLVAGVLVLRESRDSTTGPRPDVPGALILCLGVGALALGIVRVGSWGWASVQFLAAQAVATVAVIVFVRRSARHPAPVIELALLRVRATRAANISVFLFSMGFFPLLLASVLFFTEVWHYSVVQAGVAIAPGPLMVAIFSWPAGIIAGRLGPRVVAVPGVLLFAIACGWWAAAAGASPDYLGEMLWPMIMVGIGVALTYPVLAGAAVADLPASRAATGSAIFNVARQIGGVAGVAVLVAILGSSTSVLVGLRAGWIFMASAAVCAGAGLLVFGGQSVSSPPANGSLIPDPTSHRPQDLVLESGPNR